jgi:hypothetical protein
MSGLDCRESEGSDGGEGTERGGCSSKSGCSERCHLVWASRAVIPMLPLRPFTRRLKLTFKEETRNLIGRTEKMVKLSEKTFSRYRRKVMGEAIKAVRAVGVSG